MRNQRHFSQPPVSTGSQFVLAVLFTNSHPGWADCIGSNYKYIEFYESTKQQQAHLKALSKEHYTQTRPWLHTLHFSLNRGRPLRLKGLFSQLSNSLLKSETETLERKLYPVTLNMLDQKQSKLSSALQTASFGRRWKPEFFWNKKLSQQLL